MEKNQNSRMSHSSLTKVGMIAFALALGQAGPGCARPAKEKPAPTIVSPLQNALTSSRADFQAPEAGTLYTATITLGSDIETKGLTVTATVFMASMSHTQAAPASFVDANTITVSGINFDHGGVWTVRVQLVDADGNVVATVDHNKVIEGAGHGATTADHKCCSDS